MRHARLRSLEGRFEDQATLPAWPLASRPPRELYTSQPEPGGIELGLAALPLPAGLTSAAARALTRLPQLPFLPPAVEWVEAATRPSIMDASKAKRELGWRPRYTSLEGLRDTTAAR